jgi:hypothetical protein
VTKKLSSEQSKNTFFMTLIGPVVTSGCETWIVQVRCVNSLLVLERY